MVRYQVNAIKNIETNYQNTNASLNFIFEEIAAPDLSREEFAREK
ncbi:hypothetical protein SAMN05421510_101310 [Nitrosomonas ureae]|uniref:Uncharacterized protein n=1 Tax=Nitrosomonas ureae TaxID=44577 RepID=A0A1H9C7Q3_9PROT|nr:hypothetical protein C8R28_101745 [Nitrosomonas ureae]PXX15623.1 hypothetical protein C8R27_10939 [Nitrosomonas ureae]SDU08826.1 hypothetical protein SAMN05216406_1236 [Nitrosomonas ureae]SEP96833.1 hypothetical protein SAMN05421510_101310 [Nitrosomonas ureae]SOD16863.1 hypothetical protein SAMN06297164_0813 [Nitrosomonas ureae]